MWAHCVELLLPVAEEPGAQGLVELAVPLLVLVARLFKGKHPLSAKRLSQMIQW